KVGPAADTVGKKGSGYATAARVSGQGQNMNRFLGKPDRERSGWAEGSHGTRNCARYAIIARGAESAIPVGTPTVPGDPPSVGRRGRRLERFSFPWRRPRYNTQRPGPRPPFVNYPG